MCNLKSNFQRYIITFWMKICFIIVFNQWTCRFINNIIISFCISLHRLNVSFKKKSNFTPVSKPARPSTMKWSKEPGTKFQAANWAYTGLHTRFFHSFEMKRIHFNVLKVLYKFFNMILMTNTRVHEY